MKTLRFYAPPRAFSSVEWERLRQALEREEQVDAQVVVDLPAIGAEGYDEALEGMLDELNVHLSEHFGPHLTIERRSSTGGRMASCTFRIRLLETED